jgi:hypothetical protein
MLRLLQTSDSGAEMRIAKKGGRQTGDVSARVHACIRTEQGTIRGAFGMILR